MGTQNALPVCELTIHKPYDEVIALDPMFEHHLFSHTTRCSVEVSRVLNMPADKVAMLLGGAELSLSARVRETGGFRTTDGEAEIICNEEGLPLRGSCAKTPEPFRHTLWYRTNKKPVLILRAISDFADNGDGMIANATGSIWDKSRKESTFRGVWQRSVPEEWRSFEADLNNLEDQIVQACLSTEEVQLHSFSMPTLEYAVEAAMEKSMCDRCNHTHYGLIAVKPGVPQPEHNLTKKKAIKLIAHYNPESDRYFRKERSLARGRD